MATKTNKRNPKKATTRKRPAVRAKKTARGSTKKKPVSKITKKVIKKKIPEKEVSKATEKVVKEKMPLKEDIILSIVIPAYKEEKRIGNTLLSLDKYLSPLNFPYEILVVIDGSPDNTFQVVEKYQKMIKNLKIINNPENHGKGYVVRQGLLAAKGIYRLFMDADNSVDIAQIENFSPHFEDPDVGVVIGSRDIKGSNIKRHQPLLKEVAGDVGNRMIQVVAGLWGIKDTQCGFKILTAEAAEIICPLMLINRWGFDIEMLTLAKILGYKIKEVPVVWVNDEASTVTLGGYFNTLKELFAIRLGLWTGKYDIKGAMEKKTTLRLSSGIKND